MANPNWNKNKSKELSYEEAWNFINSYINSLGFKQRLYNHNSSNNAVLNKPSLKSSSYSSYNPLDNIVYLGNDYIKYGIPNSQYAAAHELGHAVDTSMSEHINPSELYSYTYPIFYNNSKFREVELLYKQKFKKDLLSDPKVLDQTVKNNYKEFHDAFPSESYADLMSLRTLLYRAGIYDSRKANSPFTKLHLEQFKKINPDFRLFKYFSDEDIITMMNEVAYSPVDNLLLYAKQGTKMNIIEQFKRSRKYLSGGPIGFITNELANSAKNGTDGKTYYFVNDKDLLFRKNSDGTKTIFPYIKGSTYIKYKSSPEFMKTLELAFNRYGRRVKNEEKQLISLSGKTKPVAIKGKGTYNIPIEIFDKVVGASKTAGINPKLGLAIAIKESSGYTDLDRKNTQFIGRDPDGWLWKSVPNLAGPSTIVSNWLYFDNSPYIGLLKGWEKSGWDAERVQEDAKYLYGKHLKDYDAYDSNLDEDILVNMFKIPLNRINSGESGYVNDIKSYMNNMSYKYGGKLK